MPGDAKVMVCVIITTLNERETVVAAAKVLLPAWLASMLQVPAATSVRVVPLTLHTPGVVDVSVTVRPEVALATRALGVSPKVWLAGALNVMVWVLVDTLKVLVTDEAAAKVLLPPWLAVTLQLPAATKVSVVPLTVHTPGVLEASSTGRPELALAAKAAGVLPSVWLPGEAKVMVCDDAPTVKDRDTTAAAA